MCLQPKWHWLQRRSGRPRVGRWLATGLPDPSPAATACELVHRLTGGRRAWISATDDLITKLTRVPRTARIDDLLQRGHGIFDYWMRHMYRPIWRAPEDFTNSYLSPLLSSWLSQKVVWKQGPRRRAKMSPMQYHSQNRRNEKKEGWKCYSESWVYKLCSEVKVSCWQQLKQSWTSAAIEQTRSLKLIKCWHAAHQYKFPWEHNEYVLRAWSAKLGEWRKQYVPWLFTAVTTPTTETSTSRSKCKWYDGWPGIMKI